MAFVREYNEQDPIICSASWEGTILEKPRGSNGFGYDPLFFVNAEDCSAAELQAEKKNSISHRAQACNEMVKRLREIS